MLRLEKGHAIVAQDTDDLTNPFEAGLGWAVRMGKPFFVGQRSLRIHVRRGARQKLVGFELAPHADGAPLIGEANLLIHERQHRRARHQHCAFADAGPHDRAGHGVACACSEPGSNLVIRASDGRQVGARVVRTPFVGAA